MPNSGLPGYETLVYDGTDAKWKPPPAPKPDKNCYVLDLPHNVREMITQKAADMRFTDPMNMYIAKWREHLNRDSDSIEIGSNEATKALLWLADAVKLHVEEIYGNIKSDSFGQDLCPYRYKMGTPTSRNRLTNYRANFMFFDAGYPFGWLYDNWQRNRTDIVVWMHEMIALHRRDASRVSMGAQRVRFLQYHIDEIDRQFRRVREMVEGLSLKEGGYLPVLAARKSRADLRVLSTKEERFGNRIMNEAIRSARLWKPENGQRVNIQDGEAPTEISGVATGSSKFAEDIPEIFKVMERSPPFNDPSFRDSWRKTILYEVSMTSGPSEFIGNTTWMPSYQLIPRK